MGTLLPSESFAHGERRKVLWQGFDEMLHLLQLTLKVPARFANTVSPTDSYSHLACGEAAPLNGHAVWRLPIPPHNTPSASHERADSTVTQLYAGMLMLSGTEL